LDHIDISANNGQEQETEISEKSSKNGKEIQSVLDKVSGMFKITAPNWSLPKPTLPSQMLNFSPRPPKNAPHVDAQLQVDLMTSERGIQMLQAEVQMLREKLDFQHDDYLNLQNVIRDADRDRKVKDEKRISQQRQHEEALKKQARELKMTKHHLYLAEQSMTALETEYQDRFATQSKEFAQQRDRSERQMADLSAQLASITSDFQMVNQTLSSQTKELKQVHQDAKSQKESLQQQIAQLETSLTEANSTNLELQDSLTSSNAALEALRKEWQDLVSKESQRTDGEQKAQDQVAVLETQNNETKTALQMAEKLLEKTIGEKEELVQENQKAWSMERIELESQVENLQLQLTNEKINKENVLSQWKSAQTERGLKQMEQQRLFEEKYQAEVDRLKAELKDTKAQYETELESMAVKKVNDVLSLKEQLKTEHSLQEQQLQDENAKLKEELAKMKQLYEQKEEERQAETKALQTEFTQQLETTKAEASQREHVLQTQLFTASAEQASKTQSLEAEIEKLLQENESLTSSLDQATKSRHDIVLMSKDLEQKYLDLRADQEKWEERVSLMKREFQHAQKEKKELETQLVTLTLEKEEYLLQAQTLEANVQALAQVNAQLQQQLLHPQQTYPQPNVAQQQQQGHHPTGFQRRPRRREASNFDWVHMKSHPPDRLT